MPLRTGEPALRRLISVLALGIFTSACATPAPDIPRETANSLASRHVIPGIPFHPQVEDQCGPASLATMLGARGVIVDPLSLRGKVYIPGKKGAVTAEMVARARQYDMLVYPLDPKLPDILKEVNAGNPVLVLQNLAYEWMPRWHFSVVTGYDLQRELVVLRSGKSEDREVGFTLFNRTWQRAEGWAVVIMLPQQLPATAKEQPYIRAANQLEMVGRTQPALTAYETAIANWPNSTNANFAAGNAAYTLEQYGQARDFFTTSVELQPGAAASWNNLAYSLLRLGCTVEAQRAVACALDLEPGDANFQHSLSDISSQARAPASTSCRIPTCPAAPLRPERNLQ